MPARDEHGRFIKANLTTKTASDGPFKVTTNPEFEKPVLSVTVNNPIRKILYWLDQIRKHQTTTFAVKLSIPLIALPVIIFAAYQLGRGSVILPFIEYKTSPTPTIKPSPSPTPPIPYSRSGTLKIAKVGTQTKYVLALRNGDNVVLEIPQGMDLSTYRNKQVLVTGIFDRQANLIKVTEIAEIEVINETIAPSMSPVPTPPQSTSSAN